MSASTRASPGPADPQTTAHLLTLPAFLLPLSPSLAALHHARVKLHLSPSPTSINAAALKDLDRRMKRDAKGWCVHCGALKARVETAAAVSSATGKESNGMKANARGRASAGGKAKRRKLNSKVTELEEAANKAQAAGKARMNDSSSFDAPDTSLPEASNSGPPPTVPSKSAQTIGVTTPPPPALKRANDCDTCGTPYSRPSPVKGKFVKPDLPPARMLRKRNSASAMANPIPGAQPVGDVFGDTLEVQTTITKSNLPAAPAAAGGDDPVADSTLDQAAKLVPPPAPPKQTHTTPKAKQAPPFRYIPSTPSSLPSYPPPSSQPPVRPDPERTSTGAAAGQSSASNSSAAPGTTAGAARKKSKKSGLAKLLAQSKEREQSGSTGNWGLG